MQRQHAIYPINKKKPTSENSHENISHLTFMGVPVEN